MDQLPYGLSILLRSVLESSGPLLGALIALKLFRIKPEITLTGTQTNKSILMISLPIILFSIFGATIDNGFNPHYNGFIIGLSIAMYGICEEYGWRAYLQNEILEMKPITRAMIIGSLWYVWHLSFLTQEPNIINEFKFLVILLLASWGIGAIADKTKSVLACASFHITGNILFLSSMISSAVDDKTRYIIFGICLTMWIIIVNVWDRKLGLQE